MKNLPYFVIVILSALLLRQSFTFEIGTKDEILKKYGKTKAGYFRSESRIFEDTILKNIISAIKNGSDCFGIPPLDPFDNEENIHFENIEIPNYVMLDYINVDGIHSTKLSEFLVNTFTFNLAGLEVVFNVTFPELNLKIDYYNISGILINYVPFLADRALQLTLRDLQIATSFSIAVSETGAIFVDGLSLQLAVGEIKFSVTGLMGGSRTSYLASEVVSEIGPKAIRQFQDSYGPEIALELQNFINSLLIGSDGEGISTSDLLGCLLA